MGLTAEDVLMRTCLELLTTNRQMLAELKRLNSKAAEGALSKDDHAFLERLFPVVHECVGEVVFTVRDLIAHAEGAPELAAVVAEVGDQATRRLGKLFARAAGCDIGIYRLERGTQLREGLLWSVSRVSDHMETRKTR